MSLTRFSGTVRSLIYCAALLAFTASILVIIGKNGGSRNVSAQDGPVIESPAADFPGTGVGPIPDGPAACNAPGTPLNISFAVTGISGAPTSVAVTFTFSPNHTFVGDLDVTLKSPGGTPAHFVFTETGGGGADSSDVAGPYTFVDTATLNWWTAAAGGTSAFVIPAGSYRTSDATGANTAVNAAFAGIPTSNGTWTLTFTDFCQVDTGSISSATLTLTGAAGTPTPTPTPTPSPTATPRDALADFDADGKTDPTVIRLAGGANSQATWWIKRSGSAFAPEGFPAVATDWGRAEDTFVPADFDGDFQDDIAIWRPGAQAQFFIIRSTNSTIRIEDWGNNGDDPTVVGDYNGDDKDDVAVYRPGATPNGESYWWWKIEGGGFTQFQWGSGSDYVAPGDYDGDKKMDYAIQRPNGGSADFWIWSSLNSNFTTTTFGNATDLVVPGDYDGDLKTDIAVLGTQGTHWLWKVRPSNGGPDTAVEWGLHASDVPSPGDYDGDGKADYAVWRIGSPQSQFWALTPGSANFVYVEWGSGTEIDTPVTNSFVH